MSLKNNPNELQRIIGLQQKAGNKTMVDRLTTIQQKNNPGYAPAAPAAPPTPTVSDNSGMINGQYDNLLSALRAQIQQGINNKNQQIGGLQQKYQPYRNDSEVRKNNDLRTALEQSANMGDRGGVGRQNSLETQSSGENRINTINLQQEDEKTSLLNDIANLTLEGNVQEAQLQAQKLRDLLGEKTRAEDVNYSRSRDSVADSRYANETSYSRLRDAVGDSRYDTQYKDNRADTQYERDYQAGRDKVSDSRYTNEFEYKQRQDSIDNAYRNKQAEVQRALDERRISSQEAQQVLENAYRQRTFEYNKLESERNYQLNASKANAPEDTTKSQEESKLVQLMDSMTPEEWKRWKETNKYNLISTFGREYYDNLD